MYKENTNRELSDLLERHESLTFNSQINLQGELKRRGILENTDYLNRTIDRKFKKIKNFDYLDDLGFEIEQIGDSIKITRTSKAIMIDLIALFLGVIFCVLGIYGVSLFINELVNGNEVNPVGLVVGIAYANLGLLGIKFLNGFKRLFDFMDFELFCSNGIVTLKKRFDLKLVEIEKSTSFLDLEEQSEKLILKLGNDEIFDANSKNIMQRLTIMELAGRLKSDIKN